MIATETACRIALGCLISGAAAIGIPFRLRADRAGGRVSTQGDPRWFWWLMAIVGPPLALVCIGFVIAPRHVDFASLDVPGWLRLLGAPLGLLGLGLFAWMFRHLGLNVTSTSVPRARATLITSGPYRWVRHPMYSAALILALSTALLTSNGVVLIGGTLMFVLLAARSRLEEQRLVDKFGAAYRAYQDRTGRFFPRVGNFRARE